MRLKRIVFTGLISCLLSVEINAQIDESQAGAWYMYFWNTTFKESTWGMQGDIQYRNWNIMGDLEQLLLRGGVTYQPKSTSLKLTLGLAHVSTGVFGDSKATFRETRIYQEALLPQKVCNRLYMVHRFRFEQRFVENQDFRTRWRYNVFANIPLNQNDLNKGAAYFAFYNELFINGERNIGNGNSVELFDRNRLYLALGYSFTDNLKIQGGFMKQRTDSWAKNQLQLSLHHKF